MQKRDLSARELYDSSTESKSYRVIQMYRLKCLCFLEMKTAPRSKCENWELVNYSVFLCFWSNERMHAQLFIKAAKQYQSSLCGYECSLHVSPALPTVKHSIFSIRNIVKLFGDYWCRLAFLTLQCESYKFITHTARLKAFVVIWLVLNWKFHPVSIFNIESENESRGKLKIPCFLI